MLSWGARRKLIVIGIVTAVALLFLGWYGFSLFYSPPSCTDGKMNQGEQGIDCGGPCARICENQTKEVFVAWQRAFLVAPNSYNVVAYAENPNPRSAARDVPYVFQLYDSRNILVAERSGTVSIPPQRTVPIFEGDVKTGNRIPVRVEFFFEEKPDWTIVRSDGPEFRFRDQLLQDVGGLPLLTARIENISETLSVRNMSLVAIIYDAEGNARTASKTVIETLPPLGSEPILFSWPMRFDFQVSRIEIVPLPVQGAQY